MFYPHELNPACFLPSQGTDLVQLVADMKMLKDTVRQQEKRIKNLEDTMAEIEKTIQFTEDIKNPAADGVVEEELVMPTEAIKRASVTEDTPPEDEADAPTATEGGEPVTAKGGAPLATEEMSSSTDETDEA